MRILSDIDLMPFGKYKGTPMQDVPSDYFHYLWMNGMKHKIQTDSVADYINRSLSALKQEAPDKIWN
jgi:hypothetical protein